MSTIDYRLPKGVVLAAGPQRHRRAHAAEQRRAPRVMCTYYSSRFIQNV